MSDINGMWQLQTIQDEEGKVERLDSVFYAFQQELIFSYTALYTDGLGRESCLQLYGYVDYPDDKTLHIIMDKAFHEPEALNILPWKAPEVEYQIIRLESKTMVLGYGDEIYTFTKY